MASHFTEFAMERMGFEKIPNEMELEATFSLVRAYRVEGIALKEIGADSLPDLCHKDQEFTFGFGNSLNEVCQYLSNEDFADNEEEWIKDNNVNPPFLIVNLSLNKFFTCKSGYWKKQKVKDRESIVTWDSFPEARESLKEKESEVIPPLIASLSVRLSFLNQPIQFKPIFSATCGKTKLGEKIYDLRDGISGRAFIPTNVNPDKVKTRIQDSLKLYDQLDSKVIRLFHAALQEDDRLKQFLNFCFVLERYTHEVFKRIKPQIHEMRVPPNIPNRIEALGKKFSFEPQAKCKGLSSQFHWCALLVWEKIDDQDVEDFKSIKDIRDDFAHGKNVTEATLPIDVAERLCLKLLSSHC